MPIGGNRLLALCVAAALGLPATGCLDPRECDYALDAPPAAIVAFAFGYRERADGTLAPGPVNEALGEVVAQLARRSAAPVHAQWEIAETLGATIPAERLHAIRPVRDPETGEEPYLSTAGIADQVAERVGDPRALGPVLVVAHRDHLCRAIESLRNRGLRAHAPPLAMPNRYDALSAQPWTRSARVYRLVDRIASSF